MEYSPREAGRLARIAAYDLAAWALRKVRWRKEVVHDVEDTAVLMLFAETQCFEPAGTTVVPTGFACEHMQVGIGNGTFIGYPTFGCGCKPTPVFPLHVA